MFDEIGVARRFGACAVLMAAAGCAAQSVTPPAPAARTAPAAQEIPTVSAVALAAAQRNVVCRERTAPGSRIVVERKCELRSETGIDTRTRDYIQRELSGQGMSGGWKTPGQIAAEDAVGYGIEQLPQIAR